MRNFVCGIDSGSTTTKMVLFAKTGLVGSYVVPTGANSRRSQQRVTELMVAEQGISPREISCLVATGYGRQNIEPADRQISEITCQAKAINWLFPTARLIIDIGGQDFKIIELDSNGKVANFAMNDKCAAGTGRYLELMAGIFGVSLDQFGLAAKGAMQRVDITSVCTVFAESEVISHVSRGTDEKAIVAGIFSSVAKRVHTLAWQFMQGKSEIVFTGGVAKNEGMIKALESATGCQVRVPAQPQITAALGAALIALEERGMFVEVTR